MSLSIYLNLTHQTKTIRPCVTIKALSSAWLFIVIIGFSTPWSLVQAIQPEQIFVLDADVWAQSRSARVMRHLPVLQKLMQTYNQAGQVGSQGSTTYQIQLQYNSSEAGELWATELKDWLITLGVAAQDIQLVPGNPQVDQLFITLVALSAN